MIRLAGGVIATIAVFALIAAAVALAFNEFTAAEGAKLKAKQKGNQTFEAKAGTVTVGTICTEAHGEGTMKGKKTEIEGVAGGGGCTTGGLKSVVHNKCAVDVHIAESADLIGSKCATIEVPSTKCLITITGEQKGLKAVTFKNEGAELVGTGSIAGINFTTGKTGKLCGFATETAEGTATYNGSGLAAGTNVK